MAAAHSTRMVLAKDGITTILLKMEEGRQFSGTQLSGCIGVRQVVVLGVSMSVSVDNLETMCAVIEVHPVCLCLCLCLCLYKPCLCLYLCLYLYLTSLYRNV